MDPRLLYVNRQGVLSTPASMWWCWVFLLRHSILLTVVMVTAFVGGGSSSWAYGLISLPVVLGEAPMWLLVLAWTRRLPSGGQLSRRVWRRGREIMSLTAGLGLAWALWFLSGQEEWRPWPERMVVLTALIDLAIIVGCWRSALYRAVFMEFPPAPARLE